MLVAVLFVRGLLRHRSRRAQRTPSRPRHSCQREIRLGLRDLALGDGDTLIQFWRIDDREHLALMDLSANVFAPLLNVAHNLAVYWGAVEGANIAGQHEFARLPAALRRGNRHRRD